jgi:uncharacterized protein (TIGR02145 family)
MATYSLIQYNVLKDTMYFKGTSTPGLESTLEDGGFFNEENQDIIQGVFDAGNDLVPTIAVTYLKTFLSTLPGINVNNADFITLNINIIEGFPRDAAGRVSVISFNVDGTKSYATANGASFPGAVVLAIKPVIKYPPLGKCRNCLKFTFQTDHAFNFVGNLDGGWNSGIGNGGYLNNQKVYTVTIPNYSSSPTAFSPYTIFWKPNANYTGTDYNGNPFTITGNRWIACPSTDVGTVNELSPKTFFQTTSGSAAPCPYTPPTSTWYNFFGSLGFFLLENPDPIFKGVCPEFYHYPDISNTNSGYNCSDEGCVQAASGSIGQYATLAECQVSCSFPGPGTYGYICTPNGCVEGTALNTGSFTTLAECQTACQIILPPTSCSCDPITNLSSNSDFTNGSTDWVASPSPYLSGVGGWTFGGINAGALVETLMSTNGTSSISLTQTGILQPSCSYSVCFQAWAPTNANSCSISIATGNPSSPALLLAPGNLTSTPTAFTLNLDPAYTTDLTFYFGLTNPSASSTRIYIDGICVTNTKCPPPTPSSSLEDCLITGSAGIYEEVEYDCICPEGYTPDGSGSCIGTGATPTLASSGIYTTNIYPYNIPNPGTMSLALPGFSINQYDSLLYGPIDPNNPNPLIPRYFSIAQPVLYYEWNFNGTGNPSTGNPSPIEANPNKYKTQYTFDILKNSFWYRPDLQGPANSFDRWVSQLMRNNTIGMPQTNGNNERWAGMGTTIDVPSPKTYYIGIIGQGAMKIKLDGTTILCTSPTETFTPEYSELNYPAYAQSLLSRNAEYPSGSYYWPSIPAPFYSFNPYITSSIQGALSDWDFANPGPEYPNFSLSAFNSPGLGKFLSGYNLYIYPVTMSAGCHQVAIEGNPDYFKYCQSLQGAIGGVIFDNTAAEIANATSLSNLNIVWDSSYLNPITESFIGFSGVTPLTQSYYLYSYPQDIIPPSSSYISWCPSGSIPVGGNPCNGCISSGSIATPILPCGSCLECVNGRLYNGYVIDKGGYTLQGRGTSGIVNTDAGDNPINTWTIPGETEWNNLITELNNGTTPNTTTGALGTVAGGKMKDYTRDLTATCWENPNIGAQTEANASGWAGVAGGKRLPAGTYEGLGFKGIWWSANSNSPTPYLYTRELNHYSSDVFRNLESKNNGFSIRLCRPVESGEVTGDFIPDAYVDNSGTIYDGVVIGDYVWITKNLSDTLYNDGSPVVNMVNTTNWSNAISTGAPYNALYDNSSNNISILVGNYNTFTGECYDFPTDYIYQKCGTNQYLIQTESGSTTTIGEVQKDSNGDCWSFYGTTNGNPNIPASSTTNHTGNYFSGSNYVYNDCDECNAIHTMYVSFTTKNC